MERERIGKADWLRAARSALPHGGPGAVGVETLARTLKVTKGSFCFLVRRRRVPEGAKTFARLAALFSERMLRNRKGRK